MTVDLLKGGGASLPESCVKDYARVRAGAEGDQIQRMHHGESLQAPHLTKIWPLARHCRCWLKSLSKLLAVGSWAVKRWRESLFDFLHHPCLLWAGTRGARRLEHVSVRAASSPRGALANQLPHQVTALVNAPTWLRRPVVGISPFADLRCLAGYCTSMVL